MDLRRKDVLTDWIDCMTETHHRGHRDRQKGNSDGREREKDSVLLRVGPFFVYKITRSMNEMIKQILPLLLRVKGKKEKDELS